MKYLDLKDKIKQNIFTFLDVRKYFPEETDQTVKVQLARFFRKRLVTQIKRGIYCFDPKKVDELVLAGHLYQPSYISLETALNYYGIIPDIPQTITSVDLITTKTLSNNFGTYYYAKIQPKLFFGYEKAAGPAGEFFNLAQKEKALLDYFYIRKIKNIADLRLNTRELNFGRYQKFLKDFPLWVSAVKI